MFSGENLFSFSALHLSTQDLTREKRDGSHSIDLVQKPEIFLNIDLAQMGVGGDNSWGAKTHAEYRIPYKAMGYTYIIKTIGPDQSPWKMHNKPF